ncbi:MAG: DUF2877 domain-containing protein [Candidatus Riflebacteria bacterium]
MTVVTDLTFARRACWPKEHSRYFQAGISNCYLNGFDVITPDSIVFFTFDAQRLNPLSILISESVISNAWPGLPVKLEEKKLVLGNVELNATREIADPQILLNHNENILRQNLQRLHSNIKLFGRSSEVKDLVLGCNNRQNLLSGAEALLVESNVSLEKLKGLLGAGEGLTPSFDDFLAGMLLADRMLKFNLMPIPRDFFAIAAGKTTRQSLQQLVFAASGRLNLAFEEFCAGLCMKEMSSATILKVMHYGHSSGTDILCGIWWYIERNFSHFQALISRSDSL